MRYFIRSLKYFLYITVILFLIIAVLYLVGWAQGDFLSLFRNGSQSIVMMLVMMAIFALIYPRFGYSTQRARVPGEYEEIRQDVITLMTDRGYRYEKEEGQIMTFRMRSVPARITRVGEDRITLTHTLTGFDVEGLTRDAVRVKMALENRFLTE